MEFKALVTRVIVIVFALLGMALAAAPVLSQPKKFGLDLRSNQPRFLNQGDRIQFKIVITDANTTNVTSIKFVTTGGLKIVDIIVEPNFLSVNKKVADNSVQIDIAKTDLFTNEEPIADLVIEMAGTTSGEIKLEQGSLVGGQSLTAGTKVQIQFLGGTKMGTNAEAIGISSPIQLAIAAGIALSLILGIWLAFKQMNPRNKAE